jgi:general secretion pathway protein G
MMFIKNRSIRKAFTLVELLIVIIIIAVIAAIAIPKFSDSSLKSKEAALKSNLRVIRGAVELFRADTGAYPTGLSSLTATTGVTQGLNSSGTTVAVSSSDLKLPYLQSLPNDPIANAAFSYVSSGTVNIGKVTSSASGTGSDGTNYSAW